MEKGEIYEMQPFPHGVDFEREVARAEVDLITSFGIKKTDRILDLGCGAGFHCLELARSGFSNVIGVDKDLWRGEVKMINKWASEEGLNVDFVQGDWDQLPFEANTFDFIFSLAAYGAPDGKMASVYRTLKPGGKFLFDTELFEEQVVDYVYEQGKLTLRRQIEQDDVDVLEVLHLDPETGIKSGKFEVKNKKGKIIQKADTKPRRVLTLEQQREQLLRQGFEIEEIVTRRPSPDSLEQPRSFVLARKNG